jgi:transposase-like protein
MSRPEIAIQQKRQKMEGQNSYVKRTQKDYPHHFKIQVVREVESGEISLSAISLKYGIQGESTVKNWLKKYGNFDWENQNSLNMPKTPQQKLLELEAKVKLLERENARLKNQNHIADQKAIIFDMMIDIAEKEYKIDIRKNSESGQSKNIQSRRKKV